MMVTLFLMPLTRSGIHLDGSSFRLSSSRNQSDDDSADPPKPCKLLLTLFFVLSHPSSATTSTARSFLRMRPSSGNSSDGGECDLCNLFIINDNVCHLSADLKQSLPFLLF